MICDYVSDLVFCVYSVVQEEASQRSKNPNGVFGSTAIEFALVSESGTNQEECPLLKVPVAVHRNFTQRPESIELGYRILAGKTRSIPTMVDETLDFSAHHSISPGQVARLGQGKASHQIASILEQRLKPRNN